MGHDSESDPSAQTGNLGANALRDKPGSGGDPAPLSCSLVWNPAAMDSVLHCPDPRPPSPR